MKQKCLPSEGLKILACLTMLLDHGAAASLWSFQLRILGRMAFPIYCFLLAEGNRYTKNPGKYGQRLVIAMVLSEIPFDLALWGKLTWSHQNVLVTLLLGFGMLRLMEKTDRPGYKLLLALPFLGAAELLHCDYGAQGIAMILLFGLAETYGWSLPKIGAGLLLVSLMKPSYPVSVLGIRVPIELFSLLALVPLSLYSGKKCSHSKWVQWAFYLFYPVHLAVIALF